VVAAVRGAEPSVEHAPRIISGDARATFQFRDLNPASLNRLEAALREQVAAVNRLGATSTTPFIVQLDVAWPLRMLLGYCSEVASTPLPIVPALGAILGDV
jgi:hypothetical protein